MRLFKFVLFLLTITFCFPQEVGKIEEKVEVYLVLVPAVVVDKKGNFVEGLKKEDFEIFEDGEKQEISTFYLQKFYEGRLQIEGMEEKEKKDIEKIAGQRTIVIIFDQMISNPFYVTRLKEPLENFLKKFLRYDDRVLFLIGGRSYFWWGGQFVSSSLDPVGEMVKKAMLGYYYPQDFKGIEGSGMFNTIIYETITFQSLRRLKDIAEGLKRIEGEKVVILLSEGYGSFVSARSKYRELQDASYMAKFFNDSNCKVYSMDIGGLRDKSFDTTEFLPAYKKDIQVGADSSMVLSSFEQTYLRELSHETGGKSITNTNDINEGLQIIGNMISKSYILGYTPKKRNLDGKYRKIEVKVKRKGLEVRHRKGYFASDWREEQFKELEEFLRKGKKDMGKGMNIFVDNQIVPTSDGNYILFSIEPENLALSTLLWDEEGKEKRIFTSRFLILAEITDERNVVRKAKDEIYFMLEKENLKNKPIILWATQLEEGKHRIKVAIEDKNSGLMQLEEKDIYVSFLRKKKEGIDRLFFVNESGLVRPIGEEAFFPEINGRRLYPKIRNEFSRNEMLSIYFDYLSMASGEVSINFNIFKDDKIVKTTKERIEIKAEKTPIYRSIPLFELEGGEYLLEIKVINSENEFREERIFKVF